MAKKANWLICNKKSTDNDFTVKAETEMEALVKALKKLGYEVGGEIIKIEIADENT